MRKKTIFFSWNLKHLIFSFSFLMVNATFSQLVVATYTHTQTKTLSATDEITFTISPSISLSAQTVLREVYLDHGGSGSYNGDLSKIKIELIAPNGNSIVLANDMNTGNTINKLVCQVTFRSSEQGRAIKNNYNSNMYPMNKGYYAAESSFTLAGNNASGGLNGPWKLKYSNVPTTSARIFRKVMLSFGAEIPVIDIRSNINQDCQSVEEILANKVYLTTNIAHAPDKLPLNLVGTCQWNATSSWNNRSSWFKFKATANTGKITVFDNGSTTLQMIVVDPNSASLCSNLTGISQIGTCLTNGGFTFNHAYTLSGLTIGKYYLILIDGTDNTASTNFSIEYTSFTNSALPIELLSFSANQQDQYVDLVWETASERDNDYFTLLRSSDLSEWEEIGIVKGGNSNTQVEYNFRDENPSDGISYYKLMQTDYNGDSEEFDPVSVNFDGRKKGYSATVYPNPAKDYFEVKVYGKKVIFGEALMQICDISGKTVMSKNVKLLSDTGKIKLDEVSLEKGIYFLNIIFPNGEFCATRLSID